MLLTKERIDHFDILRGVAIVAVVAIHVSASGLRFEDSTFNFHFTVLWRNVLNFAVPLFVVLSGYFLAEKKLSNPTVYIEFLKKQISKIYVPMMIWSAVWGMVNVVAFKSSFQIEIVKAITFSSNMAYYFIALIIQFYLLLPMMQKVVNKHILVLTIFISLATTLFVFYIRYYQRIDIPVLLYGGNFLTYIMFFMLGLYLRYNSIEYLSHKFLVLMSITFYILSCFESYVLFEAFGRIGDSVTAVKPSSFMYSFFLILLLFRLKGSVKSRLLSNLGRMSFGIYLTHMFVLALVGLIVSRYYPYIINITVIYQFLVTLLVVSGCYTAMNIFKSKVSYHFGIKLGFF